MRERVVLLDGHLTVESLPGSGTRLTAELSLVDRPAPMMDSDVETESIEV
jgi:signal transduction histidine kinase